MEATILIFVEYWKNPFLNNSMLQFRLIIPYSNNNVVIWLASSYFIAACNSFLSPQAYLL